VFANEKNYLSTYDLILSSEGIYSPASLPQFTSVLVTCLRGQALVASKKVYFGVGGGVTEFLTELAKHNRTGSIVWEGGQVTRVIIQI
jgi:protein-histidine N-methyltransferase